MPLTVLSPFSGRPVKVRDQDVGRAVRDEEGRIFYVVPKADGNGYYAAPTRKGSDKDEQRYADLETKTDTAEVQVKQEHAAVHDATGPGRKAGKGKLVLLLILLLIGAAVGYVLVTGVDNLPFLKDDTAPSPPTDQPAAPAPDAPGDARLQLPSPPANGEPAVRVNPEAFALLMQTNEPPSPPRADAGAVAVNASPKKDASQGEAASEVTDAAPVQPDALELERRRIVDAMERSKPFTKTASGLRYRVEEAGTGTRARAGKFVLIHYTVAQYKPGGGSRVIDTSRKGNTPLGFVLWSGQVIRGWDEGIAGMKAGERRTLIIPATLAGGTGRATAHEALPEDNLLCEIELVDVRPGVEHLVEKVGAGRLAYPGDTVELHYTASIAGKDKPFDDSYVYGQPLKLTIGGGEIIQGLELGITGMAVGEVRTIEIPSYLGYGSRGAGSLIPPDSDLSYRVELLRVVE